MIKIHRKVLETKQVDENNIIILVKDFSLIFNKKLLKEGNCLPEAERTYTFHLNGNEITKVEILTVDICLFSLIDDELHILSIVRKHDPFKGCLANPGGFIDEGEENDTLSAANRELMEECTIDVDNLELIGSVHTDYRDPRNRYSSTYIYSKVLDYLPNVVANDDADEFKWIRLPKNNNKYTLPNIKWAFDHADIIQMCLNKFNL